LWQHRRSIAELPVKPNCFIVPNRITFSSAAERHIEQGDSQIVAPSHPRRLESSGFRPSTHSPDLSIFLHISPSSIPSESIPTETGAANQGDTDRRPLGDAGDGRAHAGWVGPSLPCRMGWLGATLAAGYRRGSRPRCKDGEGYHDGESGRGEGRGSSLARRRHGDGPMEVLLVSCCHHPCGGQDGRGRSDMGLR
jgi:hypothetical protein